MGRWLPARHGYMGGASLLMEQGKRAGKTGSGPYQSCGTTSCRAKMTFQGSTTQE